MCLLAKVTHQSQSPTWLSRRSRHRVWLKDVALYVFCQKYRHENMRQNKAGAFEIYFVSEEAAGRFREVFFSSPGSEPPVRVKRGVRLGGTGCVWTRACPPAKNLLRP